MRLMIHTGENAMHESVPGVLVPFALTFAHLEDAAPQGNSRPGEVPRPHGAVELVNLVFRLHPALIEQRLRGMRTGGHVTNKIRWMQGRALRPMGRGKKKELDSKDVPTTFHVI